MNLNGEELPVASVDGQSQPSVGVEDALPVAEPLLPTIDDTLCALEAEEPLSLAEEIAAEKRRPRAGNPRPLRADQAVGRHPHRRTAADVDGRVDRGGPQGEPHRVSPASRSRT